MRRVVTMGGAEDRGNVGPITGLAQLTTGQWVMAKAHDPTQLSVFDSVGAFVRMVGRNGDGPGEFHFAAYVRSSSEWFEVYDGGLHRMSRFSNDFKLISTRRLPFSFARDVQAFPSGELIVAATERTGAPAGWPLHFVGADGTLIRSFGVRGEPGFRTEDSMRWAVAVAPDGFIWAAQKVTQRLQKWNSEGRMVQDFTRTAPWFQPSDTLNDGSISPASSVVGIQVDETGRIWVLNRVADGRWRTAVRKTPSRLRPGKTFQEVVDPRRYYDTIVEVLDPSSGRVLATARADQYLTPFIGPGMTAEVFADHDEVQYVSVWKLSLPQRGASN